MTAHPPEATGTLPDLPSDPAVGPAGPAAGAGASLWPFLLLAAVVLAAGIVVAVEVTGGTPDLPGRPPSSPRPPACSRGRRSTCSA